MDNISLYTAGAFLIISEILPFIPNTGNGFLHTIIEIIKGVFEFINKNKQEINEKILEDKTKEYKKDINGENKNTEELKKRLEEVNKELEKYSENV